MNKIRCPHCNSENVSLFTRIVGYFSNIKVWNKSKLEELKARKKGSYKI
jgi:anaerobic ribonucleoside-triphosphate reductase